MPCFDLSFLAVRDHRVLTCKPLDLIQVGSYQDVGGIPADSSCS